MDLGPQPFYTDILGWIVGRDPNQPEHWPSHFTKDAEGESIAKIVAVWLIGDMIMVQVLDTTGHSAALQLSHVLLSSDDMHPFDREDV